MSEEPGRIESQRRAEEAVEQFIQAGQFENAGQMLLRLGEHRRAAQAFWKCGQFKKAGDCALRARYYAQAGEAYLRAGEHVLAAKAFTQAKEMGRAAEAYEAGGKFQEASRMYLLVKNYTKAGELFQRIPDLHPQFREASGEVAKALWGKDHGTPPEAATPPPRVEPPPPPAPLDFLETTATPPANLQVSPEESPFETPPREALTESAQWTLRVKALQESALLQELTLADIREMYSSGRIVEVTRGATIIGAGEAGQTLYILLEGLVKITAGLGDEEDVLSIRVPGDHFGEMSLLENEPTSANVIAAEDSVLFALDRAALEPILNGTSPLALKLYRAFVKTLSQRLRKATTDLALAGRN